MGRKRRREGGYRWSDEGAGGRDGGGWRKNGGVERG